MGDALHIGPVALAWPVLLALGAAWLGMATGGWMARRGGVDADKALWAGTAIGFAAARLAFVWQFRSAYFSAPWAVLDVRDGGWVPEVGFAAAWLYGVARLTREPVLKRPLLAALVSGSVAWIAGAVLLALQAPAAQRLPKLALATLDGAPASLEAFDGQPVVINLWATWCPPCVREMPVLQAAQAARPDVHFVFVNQGEPPERVRAWLAQRGLALRNVLVDARGASSAAFDSAGLPTTLFYDRDGRLVARRMGEVSAGTLAAQLERASARAASAAEAAASAAPAQ